MTARTQVNEPETGQQDQSSPVKRWYHLNLLYKFMLIFLLVTIIPMLCILFYVASENRQLIAEQMKPSTLSNMEIFREISQKRIAKRTIVLTNMQQNVLEVEPYIFDDLKDELSRELQMLCSEFALPPHGSPLALYSKPDWLNICADSSQIERLVDNASAEVNISINRQWQGQIAQAKSVVEEQARQERFDEFDEQARNEINELASNIYHQTLNKTLPVTMGFGILGGTLGVLFASTMIRPIKQMTVTAQQISRGNVHQVLPVVHAHDEIGQLVASFYDTTRYLQTIAAGAQKISEGEFPDDITPVSVHDALGSAFQKMTTYLKDIAELAVNISRGDLNQVVIPKSEADVLGNAVYQMTRYLQQIAQVAKKVASGNLSEGAQLQSEHDFLGRAFAEMISKLRYLVSKIRAGADQLVLQGMDSHSRAQEEAASVEKISLSVEETSSSMNEMAATIQDVNERMKQLSSFIGESSSSIEELNSSIRQIVTHGEQLASASQDTSSSIQQISASMQQIADTAQHAKALSDGARQDAIDGREAVEMMINSMTAIEQMVTITAEAILSVNKRTESISKILAVIKDMSDQTSLLSINASIIAKKSGERGREFNVIADRVRKLADQSNSSAKEIAVIIRDVQKESSHAVEVASIGREKVLDGVKLAESAGKALDKIISGANESSSVVSKIAETTVEQTKISQYIMQSMEQVVEMVNQIKVATKEQDLSSSYIMTQAEQVLLLSQQVKQAISDQTGVVKHVSEAMDNIRALIEMTSERAHASTEAALMLSQHADALKQLVSQFSI
ncbi:methyl-accepting chemotaxis sensory transducer [Candidatus Moduliflexus flocculans]|uniref:Methyl-accepting chemotaxis sensory transducer n=1 Tax=Candidatus Moduliflexus flocculans TaxID=1499966 RepID=A0A0S6VQQ7_9BACT|nr:methyl-accepting chemotaxis sensory transducer [Candidatus Moduliflexus flocculans]